MLSISTAWNYNDNVNVKEMLLEIKEIGCNAIELGYQLKHTHLEEIIGLLDEMQMKVSSIHNFCPMPYDTPSLRHSSGYYLLSSLDEAERKKAVEWTKVSVDTACRVKTKVVIIHAGGVELDNDPTSTFMDMYRHRKGKTKEFDDLREKLLKLREKQKGPYLDALTKSLKDVMAYAKEKNIIIGLETRYYPHEIPNFEEIGYFLNLFHNQGMFYWHDTGHAEVNEKLGITKHLDFLNQYKGYLIGVHIHGVKVLKDHLAPFAGDSDILKVAPFLNNDQLIKVIESHSIATTEQIKEAVKRLS